MFNERMPNENAKSIAVVLHEIKDDLKEFLETRYEMLRAELKEKVTVWKTSLPLVAIALLTAFGGFLALTFALVAALRPMFESEYGWAIAAFIVAAVYLVVAGILAWLVARELRATGVAPTRTLQVLKQDQVWLQNEARQQP